MGKKIRLAQFGTKHGHAKGVLEVMLAHSDVEVVGVWEPDKRRQDILIQSNDPVWKKITWIERSEQVLSDKTIIAISSEGANNESLDHTEAIIKAGKHVFY